MLNILNIIARLGCGFKLAARHRQDNWTSLAAEGKFRRIAPLV